MCLAVACEPRAEGGAEAQPPEPSSAQASDRAVPPPEPTPAEERYVVLGGTITELVAALGHEAQIAGVDTSSTYPPSIEARPRVGFFRKINAEGIVSLAPTRLLVTEEAGPAEVLERLEQAELPITRFSAASGVEPALARVMAVGEALGEPERAEALVASMRQQLEQVAKRRAAMTSRPKVLFVYARGANMVMVSGKDTPATEMITLAGAENAVQGFEGFKPLSPEVVLGAEADFVLMPAHGAESVGGLAGLEAMPGLGQSEAVKRGRVILVDDLALLGFGPRFPEALLELQDKLGAPTLERAERAP